MIGTVKGSILYTFSKGLSIIQHFWPQLPIWTSQNQVNAWMANVQLLFQDFPRAHFIHNDERGKKGCLETYVRTKQASENAMKLSPTSWIFSSQMSAQCSNIKQSVIRKNNTPLDEAHCHVHKHLMAWTGFHFKTPCTVMHCSWVKKTNNISTSDVKDCQLTHKWGDKDKQIKKTNDRKEILKKSSIQLRRR